MHGRSTSNVGHTLSQEGMKQVASLFLFLCQLRVAEEARSQQASAVRMPPKKPV